MEDQKEKADEIIENQEEGKTDSENPIAPDENVEPVETAEEEHRHDDEEPDFKPEDLLPDSVSDLLQVYVGMLHSQAWMYMGLAFNPKTKKITQDLGQAKLAIDAAAKIVEVLEPQLSEKEKQGLKGLINDLRMNFISKSMG